MQIMTAMLPQVAYCLLSINGLWKAREADPGFKEHKVSPCTTALSCLNMPARPRCWPMTRCYALQANLLTLPVLAVSAFVASRGLIPLWTTALGLGEVARSTYALLHRLWHQHA